MALSHHVIRKTSLRKWLLEVGERRSPADRDDQMQPVQRP